MRLYHDLAPWFDLVSPPADQAVEAARYRELILAAAPSARTLLDLGAGGGNNASHLKHDFDCTLADVAAPMLALSRSLNPECEHVVGDMRALRLGRVFDAVLVHDAVSYLTDEGDVAACLATAAAHLGPGGVLVVAPDCTRETFEPGADVGGADGPDGRSARYLEWSHPLATPDATAYAVDFVVVTRHADGRTGVFHERHQCGVFPESTWLRLLEEAGFAAELHPAQPDQPDAPQPVLVAIRRA